MLGQLGPLAFAFLFGLSMVWRYGLNGDHINGYLGLGLVILTVVFGGANLLMPPTLILDEHGFTWRSWRYSATFQWQDIQQFLVGPTVEGGQPKIAFDFLPGHIPSKIRATEVNRSISGFDRSMANVWQMPTVDLVGLLNEYLQKSRQAGT